MPAAAVSIDLAAVQGLILRSYGMDSLRVFSLRVQAAEAAREVLGRLPITSATPWENKPDFCVNVALTFSGLEALALPADSLNSFPEDFRQGAAQRAAIVGDTGNSAPENWASPWRPPQGKPGEADTGIHALVILYAQTDALREAQSTLLRSLWNGAFAEVAANDAGMLPGNVAHFGYRDGFSQPAIEGGLPNPLPDPLPKAPAGEFLLGYESQFQQFTYPIPAPDELGRNGSFLAVRILAQDCAAFERLLAQAPAQFGIDSEKLAAKMVGRWRNGTPLHASPDTDSPQPALPMEALNNYDYLDDPKGLRCPIGAHMRRNNPRSSPIAGGVGINHRIMRRGLPYGPPFDPTHPDDGVERGLLGLFIAVSLKDQFEFLMSEWVNGSLFAPGLSGTKDPILGDHPDGGGRFVIPLAGGKPVVVSGFSRLVTTRGAAYAFLPGLAALRYIATLKSTT